MKKKVLIISVCVIIFVSLLSISSFAYVSGTVLPAGTVIVFNDTVSASSQSSTGQHSITISFESNGNTYSKFTPTAQNYTYNRIDYISSNNVTAYQNGSWTNVNYKTITLLSDFSTSDTVMISFLNQATITTPPPPPNPINDSLSNTNAMFGTTLSVMTVIITWLLANQIALCGLYLYILIACISIGKRFVKT